MNNLTLHLEGLEKEQSKPRVSRRKEIIKIRAEINEIDTKTNNRKDWLDNVPFQVKCTENQGTKQPVKSLHT